MSEVSRSREAHFPLLSRLRPSVSVSLCFLSSLITQVEVLVRRGDPAPKEDSRRFWPLREFSSSTRFMSPISPSHLRPESFSLLRRRIFSFHRFYPIFSFSLMSSSPCGLISGSSSIRSPEKLRSRSLKRRALSFRASRAVSRTAHVPEGWLRLGSIRVVYRRGPQR